MKKMPNKTYTYPMQMENARRFFGDSLVQRVEVSHTPVYKVAVAAYLNRSKQVRESFRESKVTFR